MSPSIPSSKPTMLGNTDFYFSLFLLPVRSLRPLRFVPLPLLALQRGVVDEITPDKSAIFYLVLRQNYAT